MNNTAHNQLTSDDVAQQHRSATEYRSAMILQALRNAGGRVTAPRRAVLDALLSGGDHPTAEDLAARVREVHPDVAVSTIYRILEHLEDLGVLVHVHLGHGPAVYHFADDTHVHLVCRACGHTTPLPAAAARSIARNVLNASGFQADLAHFSITGVCEACTTSSADRAATRVARS